jgi:hypothetical protein
VPGAASQPRSLLNEDGGSTQLEPCALRARVGASRKFEDLAASEPPPIGGYRSSVLLPRLAASFEQQARDIACRVGHASGRLLPRTEAALQPFVEELGACAECMRRCSGSDLPLTSGSQPVLG